MLLYSCAQAGLHAKAYTDSTQCILSFDFVAITKDLYVHRIITLVWFYRTKDS